jgi:hypothetical protein
LDFGQYFDCDFFLHSGSGHIRGRGNDLGDCLNLIQQLVRERINQRYRSVKLHPAILAGCDVNQQA